MFDENENFVKVFTGGGLSSPMGIARDINDVLYVAGGGSHNIVKFDSDGNFLGTISHPDLTGPQGVAFDDRGHLFSSSFYLDQIVEFDTTGDYIYTIAGGNLQIPRSIAFEPTGAITTITEPPALLQHFALYQNFPNPFNPQTMIEFELQNSGSVTLNVYNILGQKIITLLNGEMSNGPHKVNFVATSLPSGIYYYSLESGGERIVRRMILMK